MGKRPKFEKGMKVKSIVNPLETYEILEVLRNELNVIAISSNLEFTCKKSLFEVLKDGK